MSYPVGVAFNNVILARCEILDSLREFILDSGFIPFISQEPLLKPQTSFLSTPAGELILLRILLEFFTVKTKHRFDDLFLARLVAWSRRRGGWFW